MLTNCSGSHTRTYWVHAVENSFLLQGKLIVLLFLMLYLYPGDGGKQERLRLSHQRPPPSDHHPLHPADPRHQSVDHRLHESGAVRLSVGG